MFRYEKRDIIQYFANEYFTALECRYHNKYKN